MDSSTANKAPPLPPQARWRSKHTFGGNCIYCGGEASSEEAAGHLEECNHYKIIMGGVSKGAPGAGAVGTSASPGKKRDREEGLDAEPELSCCLACGKKGCPYESGCTVLDKDNAREDDPLAEELRTAANKRRLLPFARIQIDLRTVVDGIVRSSALWANHKFIGNPTQELQMKAWVRGRLHKPGVVDSPNWISLRHAVKETLRYRRQRCIEMIGKAFHGEPFLLLLVAAGCHFSAAEC